MPPKLSIIVVTYHNEDTIVPCLSAVRDHIAISSETIIVDNSENDLTSRQITAFQSENPALSIRLLRAGQNLGFARGCNTGARLAQGDYLMFLNPDTELANDTGGVLTTFLENNRQAMIAGPMVLDNEGQIARTCRNLPTLCRIFLDATWLDLLLGRYKLLRFSHTEARAVGQIIGACLVMRREDFTRFGGFDERFFIFFEEVDLCKRVQDAGFEVWFYPAAKVIHQRGVSCESKRSQAKMIGEFRKSRSRYFRKHYGRLAQLLVGAINRAEGFGKAIVFGLLSLVKGGWVYREKAKGYGRVAVCIKY